MVRERGLKGDEPRVDRQVPLLRNGEITLHEEAMNPASHSTSANAYPCRVRSGANRTLSNKSLIRPDPDTIALEFLEKERSAANFPSKLVSAVRVSPLSPIAAARLSDSVGPRRVSILPASTRTAPEPCESEAPFGGVSAEASTAANRGAKRPLAFCDSHFALMLPVTTDSWSFA